jgi:pentatricopeptide repeat protein
VIQPKRGDYALLVNYYGKKGDKHSARSMFERMRATGIDPNVHVYTNLVHAYAMAQDMRGATACVEEMEAEGVAPNPATHSVLISGFAKLGNAEYGPFPNPPMTVLSITQPLWNCLHLTRCIMVVIFC